MIEWPRELQKTRLADHDKLDCMISQKNLLKRSRFNEIIFRLMKLTHQFTNNFFKLARRIQIGKNFPSLECEQSVSFPSDPWRERK